MRRNSLIATVDFWGFLQIYFFCTVAAEEVIPVFDGSTPVFLSKKSNKLDFNWW